jgi:hypothetical protein
MNSAIAVKPDLQSPSFTITLESTGIFLGILVSFSLLAGILVKVISNFNSLNAEIRDLKEDLNSHSNMEGHDKLLPRVKEIEDKFQSLDKRFDVHLQDYSGYKDIALLAINGNKELIIHKWIRTEEEFQKTNSDVKELQRYLQQRGDFRIRE